VSGERVFTGLIADVGRVSELARDQGGIELAIQTRLADGLAVGESVAVNGVCLTATDVRDGAFAAQAMPETLRRSALGSLAVGALVNLERALRASDPLGGHIVQGHVDGVARVLEVRDEGMSRVLGLATDEQLARYLVHRGSVALDGVSLTVSALSDDGFEVSLIPETLQRTTLGELGEGDAVNVEVDILAKHVERLLEVRA
jgi:riboflavin synthase